MLTIRAQQLTAMRDTHLLRLAGRACELASIHWRATSEHLGHAALHRLLHAALIDAAGHGVNLEADLLRYANVALACGAVPSSCARHPWAAIILADTELSGTDKLDLLCKHTARMLAQRQESMSHAGA